jgi:DNA-binding MarR family transcriptional regulator
MSFCPKRTRKWPDIDPKCRLTGSARFIPVLELMTMTAYSSDRKADRLLELSNEVNRIASTLARLSVDPGTAPPPGEIDSGTASVTADRVRDVLRARRLRARYFRDDLFADPAWDMLLDLFRAELTHHRVAVSSLCVAAAVPPTTALRWLTTLVGAGLVIRRNDPHDARRVFVELSPEASASLRAYFAEVDAPTI